MPALRYADTLSNLTLYKANHETTVGMAAGVWGHLMASVINKRLPGILMIGSGPCTTNTLMSAYTAKADARPMVIIAGQVEAERGVDGNAYMPF